MSYMSSTKDRKARRARRSFTPEFKAEIVELCRNGDRSIGAVARDFDLTETARARVGRAGRCGDLEAGNGFLRGETR
jgi:transposase-like protein